MKWRFWRASWTLILAFTISVSAQADPKSDAQILFTDGNRLAAEGDFVNALAKFRDAYAVFPSAKILLNIGTILLHLGRNVEAAETYELYLHAPGADAARSTEVRQLLGEIEQQVGRIHLRLSESAVQVSLDGRLVKQPKVEASGTLLLRVDPGEHTIIGYKPGFLPTTRRVSLVAGEDLSLSMRLVTPPAPARNERPPRELPRRDETQRLFGYGLLGTAAGAVVVASIFGILAKVRNDQAADHCLTKTVCDEEGVRLGDSAKQSAAVSTISFVIAGAALGSGALLLYTAPDRDQARGLSVEGRW